MSSGREEIEPGEQAPSEGGDTVAVRRDRGSHRDRTLAEVNEDLTAIAKTAERHGRAVLKHDKQLRELAAAVEALAQRLNRLMNDDELVNAPVDEPRGSSTGHQPPPNGDEPQPVDGSGEGEGGLSSWLLITEWHEAQALIDALAPWVETVYLRWPEAWLPTCWALHPHAVEELWTLRCSWYHARTSGRDPWTKWQDWHDRQRPSVARRLREGLERCSLVHHAGPDAPSDPVLPGADTLPQVVTAWASDGHTHWPPTITEIQVQDERQRLHEQASDKATHLNAQQQPTVKRSLSNT